MSTLSSPGIGSGLDINNIVTELVAATRAPVDAANLAKEEKFTEQISALGRLKSAIFDLDSALFDLKLPTTFSKRKVDTSTSNFSVEAGSAASPATYDVKVDKVATSHQITSQAFDLTSPVGEGTLTLQNETYTFDVEVSASDTLDTVAANINATAGNFGITATVITGDDGSYLVLAADDTGADNVIEVSVTDADGLTYDDSGLSRLAYNAETTVLDQGFTTGELINSNGDIILNNGTSSETISLLSTDTIEDAVTKINANSIGVTASLEDDGAGGLKLVLESSNSYGDHEVSISIDSDDDGDTTDAVGLSRLAHDYHTDNFTETKTASDAQITVNGAITATSSNNEFSDVIEGVVITATSAHSETADGDSMTIELDSESTEEAVTAFVDAYNAMMDVVNEVTNADATLGDLGALVSDNTTRTFLSQIRSRLSDPVQIDTTTSLSLSLIGVSTGDDGKLELDTTTLSEQIETNFENFGTLFAGDEGVAQKLADIVGEYKGTGGIVDNKITSLNTSLDRLNDEREDYDDKMLAYETRLYAQFNAMDLLVANLNATSDYLEGALSSLPGVVKKSD